MRIRFGIVALFLMAILLSACGEQVKETVLEIPNDVIAEKRVSFYGAGDNLIHNCVYWQADDNAPGDAYDFLPMYQLVAEDIQSADIAYLNQETPLGGTQLGVSSYPLFNSPEQVGLDMIQLGFDVFSHANNHVFDKGEAGIANTYNFYREQNAFMVGIHKKDEDTVKIYEKNDIKIAFVNYTYHTNGLSLSENSDYYVPLANEERMVSDIQRAKDMADFVICLVHWGEENQSVPNDVQKQHAKLLADAGCDVIVGTHPHTIQPVEFVGDTLVVYSLGNYISAQKNPVNLIGGTILFDMVVKGDEKWIENVKFEPVITQYEAGFSNIRIVPFSKYTSEMAQKHGSAVSYEYFEELIRKMEAQSNYKGSVAN